jgi:hypothetical protein
MSSRFDGFLTCVYGNIAFGIHECDLPDFRMRVCGKQSFERFFRGLTGAHEVEPERTVTWIDERLRGHGADAWLSPRHEWTDTKPMRLDGNSELTSRGIACDDGIRVNGPALRLKQGGYGEKEKNHRTCLFSSPVTHRMCETT